MRTFTLVNVGVVPLVLGTTHVPPGGGGEFGFAARISVTGQGARFKITPSAGTPLDVSGSYVAANAGPEFTVPAEGLVISDPVQPVAMVADPEPAAEPAAEGGEQQPEA